MFQHPSNRKPSGANWVVYEVSQELDNVVTLMPVRISYHKPVSLRSEMRGSAAILYKMSALD